SINPAWSTTLGWSESKLVGESCEGLLHPDDRESSRREFEQLATGRKALNFLSRLQDKDGSYHLISWAAVLDGERLYCTGRDITEQTRALRQSETRYQNLFQAMAVSFSELDYTGSREILRALRDAGIRHFRRHFQ